MTLDRDNSSLPSEDSEIPAELIGREFGGVRQISLAKLDLLISPKGANPMPANSTESEEKLPTFSRRSLRRQRRRLSKKWSQSQGGVPPAFAAEVPSDRPVLTVLSDPTTQCVLGCYLSFQK